ncbi:MAG: glycosyltransferase family 8 protein [Firmicutes bacterium]|nr:glycosyltransferase family 8 protein [Bacillota bacterium]
MNSKKGIIPIFFAVDDNYAPLLNVALESIVSQASKNYEYHIHILCENLSERNKTLLKWFELNNFRVSIFDMTEHIVKEAQKMHTRDYYSKTTYFRVYIPDLFTEYDKALYLDCDIALNADISELYNFDIGENYVGGVTCEAVDTTSVFTEYAENYLGMKLPYYFNAGIMLMNLKVLREINFKERFFDILSKVKFEVAQDQDYFNVLCEGHVLFLPKAWNKTPRPGSLEKLEEIKLVHYNLSYRPWRYDGVLYEELFWKHAKKTSAYEKLLEIKRGITKKDAAYDKKWMENLKRVAYELANATDTFCSLYESGEIMLMK